MTTVAPIITALTATPALGEDWIGLEAAPTWRIGYGYDYQEDGSDGHRALLHHDLNPSAGVQFNWGRDQLVDDTTEFDSEYFSAALWWALGDHVSSSLEYRFEGEPGELEIEQLGLALTYTPWPVSISLELRQGDVALFTRDEITRPGIPNRVDSDAEVLRASISWLQENWTLYLSVEDYDYQRDLSALATRPLLQLLVKPGVLANSGLLVKRNRNLGLTLYRLQRDWTWQYTHSVSAVDDSDSRDLVFDWREYHDGFDMIYSTGYNLDDDAAWSIAIGFELQV